MSNAKREELYHNEILVRDEKGGRESTSRTNRDRGFIMRETLCDHVRGGPEHRFMLNNNNITTSVLQLLILVSSAPKELENSRLPKNTVD